jgi:spermidine/putrescine transport system permease protein
MKFKTLSLSVILFWMTGFVVMPLLAILVVSILTELGETQVGLPLTLSNFTDLFNVLFAKVVLKSFGLAALVTVLSLALAYPFAYWVARSKSQYKTLLLIMMIIPFWTSSLLRSYSMIAILSASGVINKSLLALGIIHQPLQLLFTNTAVVIGLVYNLLPFMILPIYANLETLDDRLFDAASDLGANTWQMLKGIVFPHSVPGVIAGTVLVFLPSMTLFYIPDLLGGAKSTLLGNVISDQFLVTNDWPLGSAMSVVLCLMLAVMLIVYKRKQRGEVPS